MRGLKWIAPVLVLLLGACDSDSNSDSGNGMQDDDRGSWAPSGKADEIATCLGSCGSVAPAGCWCDDVCADFGDCCPDKAALCDFSCPQLVPPAPGFCDVGEPIAVTDEGTGCVIGFECSSCPNLVPPAPGFCPDGSVEPIVNDDTGCVVGFDCLTCPTLVPPAPGFCEGGSIIPITDEQTGCLTGFDCQSCPQIVPPAPGFCPDGTVIALFDEAGQCLIGFDCLPQ